MEKYMDQFLKLSIFDQIGEEEIRAVLACIGGFTKAYDPGRYILLDGEAVECVGVVMRGMVHMIKEDVWGEKTIMAAIGPSEVFGESFVFGGARHSDVSFLAVRKTEVLFLPFQKVLHTCAKSCAYHQRLVDNMVALIAHKNLRLMEKLEVTTKRSLRAKILTYLSQESQKSGSKYFTVPLLRIEMADYLCVDRSALTRELTRMKDEGVLDYNGSMFRLLSTGQSDPPEAPG